MNATAEAIALRTITPPAGSPCAPGEVVQCGFRIYRPIEDKGVVLAPWLRQVRSIRPFDHFDGQDIERHKQAVIERLIARCPPTMACHPDATDQVFGWVCGEHQGSDQVLHFCYVRGAFRRFGFGTALMQLMFPSLGKKPLYYTHRTAAMKHFAPRWSAKWDPYRVV